MKYILLVLNLYLLLLSAMPCSDVGEFLTNDMVTIDNSHQEDQKIGDVCPPLCVCSCCSIGRPVPIAQHEQVIAVYDVFSYFFPHSDKSPQDISLAVWQPPQIA